jgi:hypothetical protein
MAPTLAKPFHRPGGVYEEKYGGWRMIAYKDGPRVRLISRNGVEHTEHFRVVDAALEATASQASRARARRSASLLRSHLCIDRQSVHIGRFMTSGL